MTETESKPKHTQPRNVVAAMDQYQRIVELEEALAEYVERYGLTDKAREVFRHLER